MDNVIESVEMAYSDIAQGGNHDKIFNIYIIESGGQYSVITENGRRGSRPQERIVARGLSSYAEAKRKFDAKEREKLNHRETPYRVLGRGGAGASSGAASQPPVTRPAPTTHEATGFKSDFPKPCTEDEALALIEDDDVYAEQKMDGVFMSVLCRYGKCTASNKLGRGVPVPPKLAAALKELATLTSNEDGLGLAGEYLEDALHVFNVFEKKGTSLTSLPYELRASVKDSLGVAYRNHLVATGRSGKEAIKFVHTARTKAEKRELYERLKAASAEGMVFKNANAPVVPGENNNLRKLKWTETVDCIVTANEQRSLECFVYVGQQLVSVGSVTCKSDADHEKVREANARGEQVICEVKYLYASGRAGQGKLIQPTFSRFRTDVSPTSCTGENLKTTNRAVVAAGAEAQKPAAPATAAPEDPHAEEAAPAPPKKARRPRTRASAQGDVGEAEEVVARACSNPGETPSLFNLL